MAFQVKSKSAEVIGYPSAQTALSLILYVMVNGFWVIPPLSRVGASDSSGEATKFPFRSRTIAYPSTCSRTEYQVQVADEHSLMGLMHSGHCSAPTTIEPPLTGFDVPEFVGVGVLAFPPQAAATMLTTASTAMARATLRNLINLPPFLCSCPPRSRLRKPTDSDASAAMEAPTVYTRPGDCPDWAVRGDRSGPEQAHQARKDGHPGQRAEGALACRALAEDPGGVSRNPRPRHQQGHGV